MPTFEIPDGPTAINVSRSGDSKNPGPAEGSAVYSVTNTASESVVGRLGIKAAGASKEAWFTVDGDRERTFDAGETQTVTVKVSFPPDVVEGNYPFRLRAVALNDPDNDHVEGPVTSANLGPGGVGTTSRLWLWILLGVVALLAISGALYYAFKPPSAPIEKAPAGLDSAKALQLAENNVVKWIDAYNARDTKALVALSEPPFTTGDTLLLSEAQIRDLYTAMVDRAGSTKISIVDITSAPLSKFIEDGANEQLLQRLKLKRDDVGVEVKTRTNQLMFAFRRSSDNVRLARVVGPVPEPEPEPEPELKMELNGKWADRAVISSANGQIVIDMSAFGRPTAHGAFVGPATIKVTFPDDATYTGELSPPQASPTTIAWSNGSVWHRRP